jgi:hypothetical protein
MKGNWLIAGMLGMCSALFLDLKPASAQFSDSVKYHLLYSTTGVLNNTSTAFNYLITNSVRLNMSQKRADANAAVNWIYGEQGSRLSNNDFSAVTDFNLRTRQQRFYSWGLGSFEKSYSLKVANRTQAGIGLAYNVLDRPDSLQLNISDGILYEYAALAPTDSSREFYNMARNSLRIRLRIRVQRLVTLDGVAFIQQSLSDGNDYIIKSNATLSVKLRKWLALSTALNYNRVQRTRAENLLLTFGISVDSWF